MRQMDLFRDEGDLFGRLCSTEYLEKGFKAVKRNKGSAGIDGVTIEDFESRLEEELSQLSRELKSWDYQPKPVRRVEIPSGASDVEVDLGTDSRSPVFRTQLRFQARTQSAPGRGSRPADCENRERVRGGH